MKQYLIIGNGTAATGCIEGIRSEDPNGAITVVSAEPVPAYCRPLISYFLEDKTDKKRMLYRPETFYDDNNCKVLYKCSAKELDPLKRETVLSNGETVKYDRLCIATGSSAFVPLMKGIQTVRDKFEFMTVEDAEKLKNCVKRGSRVLIIGAGLIGLKCAEGLACITDKITVVDLADHILSSILEAESAKIVENHMKSKGISFNLADAVESFSENTAFLKSGAQIEFDVLVTAVGVRPNIEIFKNAGGSCSRAITINPKMQTSFDNIYAAGDCTETCDVSDGNVKMMALMPNAYMEGFTAGVNMAGGDCKFDNAIPMNSIGLFGLHVMTAGSREGEMKVKNNGKNVRKLFFNGNRLVGFELIGDVKNAGILTNLIRNCTDLIKSDQDKLEYGADLSVFDEEYRRKILESVV